MNNKELIKAMQQQAYDEMKEYFISLGHGGHYTDKQKEYAIEQINEYGIRATTRILAIPRRTLQRWCRQYDVQVKRCPAWVYDWAEKRRRRREFWQRKGFY